MIKSKFSALTNCLLIRKVQVSTKGGEGCLVVSYCSEINLL